MSTNAKPSGSEQHGRSLAKVLAGAWRSSNPGLDISDEQLAGVTPLLLDSGAAALAWWRIRDSELSESTAGNQLHHAYLYQTLQADLYERDVRKAISLLRSAGVEPILVKGLAAARLYPEPGLRPCGDIDLCVRPADHRRARAVIEQATSFIFTVDLHEGFDGLDFQSLDHLNARSQSIALGESQVRVLSHEDHLRVLCLHFLRHDAYRPLWLCDIAAALESRPTDFDWGSCLGEDRRRADWVACAIGLAHQLLGARVADTPVEHRAKHLPRWLVPNVLKQWDAPGPTGHGVWKHRAPMAHYLLHPAGALRDLANRWPGPIEATISVGGSFNELPRLPFQLGYCASRTLKFFVRRASSD